MAFRRRRASRHWSLASSLILALVAILAPLLLLFTFASYRVVLTERRAEEIDEATAMARAVAAVVRGFVVDVESTTLAMSLALGQQGGTFSQAATGAYLRQISERFVVLRALFLTDLNGNVVASARGDGVGVNLSARPYMKALRGGAPRVWSGGLPGLESGRVTVAFARVVRRPDGRPKGYLVAAFYPERLMEGLPEALPPDGNVTLVDDSRLVLYTTHHPSVIRAGARVPEFGELVRAVGGHPARMINGQSSPISRGQFGALVPVPEVKWVVAFMRPLAPLDSGVRREFLREAGLIGTGILIAAIFFAFITGRLVRPLSHLAGVAAAIAQGERPDVPQIGGSAEVYDLAEGMRVMSRAVAQREDRLAFIAEASALLESSLDYMTTLANVARLAVPAFADWCAVDVVEDDGSIRRVAVVHSDPARVEWSRQMHERYPPDPHGSHPVIRVLRTGEPILATEVTDEALQSAARNPEHLQELRELGFVSGMIVPLKSRSRTIGVLSFVSSESGRHYTSGDLSVAEDLAQRAALAIENARVYERERRIAETLQRSLLPERLPEIPGVAVAARYRPASPGDVGGDWYDVIPLPGGKIGLAMGDVAGRGVRAATVMGQLRSALRAYAIEHGSPAAVVERLNTMALTLTPPEMATLLYMVVDPSDGHIRFTSAGHPPPLMLRADAEGAFLEGGGSVPVGVLFDATYAEGQGRLEEGTILLLYTDGLIEERGEAIASGLSQLPSLAAEAQRSPEPLCDHLLSAAFRTAHPHDDVALLALQILPLATGELRIRLPATPTSLRTLRQVLTRWLREIHAANDETYEIVVAASEAAANAIEHAYGAGDALFDLTGRIEDGTVKIAVRDTGQWRPPRGTHRGRGLTMMRALMDEVEVTTGEIGTEVRLRRKIRGAVPV